MACVDVLGSPLPFPHGHGQRYTPRPPSLLRGGQAVADVASDLAEEEKATEAAKAGQDKEMSDLKTTVKELTASNGDLTNTVKSLLARLDKFEKASSYEEPMCTPIAAPDKGSVYWLGDHGDHGKIPMSVTVDFKCDRAYYVKGTAKVSTCQDKGKWSVAAHPGCASCSNGCASCTSSGACDTCASARFALISGKCVEQTGLSEGSAAPSCLHILHGNKDSPTKATGYWIKIPGTTQARKMYCLMADKDLADGGGWTQVGRGVGGNIGCWSKAGQLDCMPDGATNPRATFLYVLAMLPIC